MIRPRLFFSCRFSLLFGDGVHPTEVSNPHWTCWPHPGVTQWNLGAGDLELCGLKVVFFFFFFFLFKLPGMGVFYSLAGFLRFGSLSITSPYKGWMKGVVFLKGFSLPQNEVFGGLEPQFCGRLMSSAGGCGCVGQNKGTCSAPYVL